MGSESSPADAHECGVVLYPGLIYEGGLDGHMGPGSKLFSFKSDDSPQAVLAFYREQLKKQFGSDAHYEEMPLDDSESQFLVIHGQTMVSMMITAEGLGTGVAISTMTAAS